METAAGGALPFFVPSVDLERPEPHKSELEKFMNCITQLR